MCVGRSDLKRLFPLSLRLAAHNLEFGGQIFIVSPQPDEAAAIVREVLPDEKRISVFADNDLLHPNEAALPGWLRQQALKLRADEICRSERILILGADTLVVRPIRMSDLLTPSGQPIIFYNRYPFSNRHLAYERRRVRAMAKLLDVTPCISYLLGDFIFDLALFDGQNLAHLRQHLWRLSGSALLSDVMPLQSSSIDEKSEFGEWTLYAVFVLDVLIDGVVARNAAGKLVSQVHSRNDFVDQAPYDAAAIHFVPKDFTLDEVVAELVRRGLPEVRS